MSTTDGTSVQPTGEKKVTRKEPPTPGTYDALNAQVDAAARKIKPLIAAVKGGNATKIKIADGELRLALDKIKDKATELAENPKPVESKTKA